jgi:hypothetical protein
MARIKRRPDRTNEAGSRRYDIVCGRKKVMEAYIYPSARRNWNKKFVTGSYCLQLWSSGWVVDELLCHFDSRAEAMDRLKQEAGEIHCSMVGKKG